MSLIRIWKVLRSEYAVMIKNIIWLLGCIVLFICTSGPVILLFDSPVLIYGWYILMQILVITWFIYGVNYVPFLADKKKNKKDAKDNIQTINKKEVI